MNEIVKVEQEKIGGAVVQTVNARDLHEFLESGKDFSSWIKERIKKYGFIEGEDFTTCSPIQGSKKHGGNNIVEYHISIDMAKELSMVENNEQGRKARRYFIDCEKKLRTSGPSKALKRESADARKGLAATWSDRGATAPHHFINLTYAEYKALGYDKPRSVSKKDMTTQELARLMALEVFESVKLQRLPDVVGYHALKDSIESTGAILEAALEKAVIEHEMKIGA